MLKALDLILDIICIAGIAICAIGLVLYIAAALAIVNAGDIMHKVCEWSRRR